MELKGKITKINEVQQGISKEGKAWKKISFIMDNGETYNNIICFDIFGEEKVDNFIKFNKVGQDVDVSFNIKCNEWQGKYFTSLEAWKVFSNRSENAPIQEATPSPTPAPIDEDLPF